MTKTTDMSTLVPVILSGGSGTRLWPLSREHYPKQLLALVGDLTLLQQTACRLDGMHSIAPPLVVCNEEHRFLVAEQLRRASRPAGEILLEPVGRNTAPALTLAAQKLKARGGGTLMLVMPADHVIADRESFQRAVQKGLSYAEMGRLVTFGVKPTSPDTGYGAMVIYVQERHRAMLLMKTRRTALTRLSKSQILIAHRNTWNPVTICGTAVYS